MKLKKINRILSIFLITFLVSSSFVAVAEELTPSATVNVKFEGFCENTFKNVKAEISVISSKKVTLGIASYENETLKDFYVESYNIDSTNELSTAISLLDVKNTDIVKVMVWDENLKPLYDGNYEKESILYVSNTADNSGDGTLNKPFSSLESAYNVAKNMNCDVTVNVLEGTYNVSKPINLSGSSDEYTIFVKGSQNGETVIDGGKKLGTFSEVSGKNYLVCDVADESEIYELYVNSHRAKMAQTEYVYYSSSTKADDNYAVLNFSGQNALPFDLSTSKNLFISAVNEWSYAISPVKNFLYEDSDNQTVKLDALNYNTYTLLQSNQYALCFMNSMDLLDSPGEFYFNSETKKLYYYPLFGENADNITAYIPKSEGLLKIDNAKNVTFENITFKHGTWNKPYKNGYQNGQAECYVLNNSELAKRRTEFPKIPPTWTNTWLVTNPSQVELTNCESVVFENNSFMNIGGGGIKFDDKNENCSANANVFYDIGGAAVTIGAPWHNEILFGNMDKITRNISVTNNFIRKTAQVLQGSCAISAYYTDSCNISHNDIAESSYSGITLGWGWGNDVEDCKNNIISNNKIVNILSDLWDGNHIYTLGNMPGTKIEGNYLGRTDESCGGGGYYPDEGSMNIQVNNNVIENGRNWTFNLTDYMIKRVSTDKDGNGVYENIPKNITYRGNFVNYLNKYRMRLQEGNPSKYTMSDQELTPDEILAGFTELSDFSTNVEVQAIINDAGLEEEYKYLENKISSLSLEVDNGIKKQRYFDSDDYFEICAGDCNLEEGTYGTTVAYNTSDGCNVGVNRGGRYNSIGLGEYGSYKGNWVTYNVTPEKSGVYNVYINAGSTGNCDFEVSLDGEVLNSHAGMKATGSYGKLAYSLIACGVNLEANKTYILKLEESRGAASVHSLVFDRVSDMLLENSYKDVTYETVATEDFTNYSNVTYGYSEISNHTKLSNSDLNGGNGWATSWYDGMTEPDSKITSTTGYFATTKAFGQGDKAVYTKGQKLYRKLESPISLTEDKVLRVEFTSRFGNTSDSYSGLELLKDLSYAETNYKTGYYQQQVFSLGSLSKDSKSIYNFAPWCHNLVETFTDGGNYETKFYTSKTLSKDTFYKYVAEIEVNADNTDTVRIKAYKEGESEPKNWDYVFETELGNDPITHVAFNCQNETYIKNLTLKSFSKILLANEDFASYIANGDAILGDKIATNLNKGTGFDGVWYDNISSPESGVTGNGTFSHHIKDAVYLYQKRLYNKLKEPISLTEKQKIRFEFVSLFQSYADQFSGAELMNDSHTPIFGLGSYTTDAEDQTERHWYLNAWTSNSKDSRIKSEKELYQQSYYYRYIAEIDVNPNGEETIRIKAYDVTDSEGKEPEEWDLTLKRELGTTPITHIALNCNNITYFNSLRIYKKIITQ